MADRHDLVEVRASKIKGRGVFARNAVPRGTVILAIDDSDIVDPQDPEQAKLIGAEPNHCDYLPDGTITRMRPPEVFINHSCDPNVFVLSVGGRRFVSAMNDIVPGEELVFDYSIGAFDGDWMDCPVRYGTLPWASQSRFFLAAPRHAAPVPSVSGQRRSSASTPGACFRFC